MAVSKSTNSGATWSYYQITASDGVVRDLVVDHTNSNIVYAGGHVAVSARVYRTTNSGIDWVSVSSGISSDSVSALAMDPINSSILYAATPDGLYKTTNSGSSWNNLGLTDVRAIEIRSDDPDILYAGTGAGVFESTTGGSGWTPINDGLDNTDVMTLALNNDLYLYAGTNGSSIYRMLINIGINESGDEDHQQASLVVRPNPICDKAVLSYCLPKRSSVQLAIYDVQGRLLRILVNESQTAGTHDYVWDICDNSSRTIAAGIYFCKLETDAHTFVHKLIIVQ